MNHDERHDLISDLIEHYEADARKHADTCHREAGGWSDAHRLGIYASSLTRRIEYLLEDISISAPHLLDELVARMKQKEAA